VPSSRFCPKKSRFVCSGFLTAFPNGLAFISLDCYKSMPLISTFYGFCYGDLMGEVCLANRCNVVGIFANLIL
jgi:hypothetical protein